MSILTFKELIDIYDVSVVNIHNNMLTAMSFENFANMLMDPDQRAIIRPLFERNVLMLEAVKADGTIVFLTSPPSEVWHSQEAVLNHIVQELLKLPNTTDKSDVIDVDGLLQNFRRQPNPTTAAIEHYYYYDGTRVMGIPDSDKNNYYSNTN
jgi:hypothetical protein